MALNTTPSIQDAPIRNTERSSPSAGNRSPAPEPGLSELDNAFTELQLRETSQRNDFRTEDAGPVHLEDLKTRALRLLELLERWTIDTGDLEPLRNLAQRISRLQLNRQMAPTQFGGHQSNAASPNSQSIAGSGSDPGAVRPNSNHNFGRESSVQGSPDEQGGIVVKRTHRHVNRCAKLRCPLFFNQGEQRCERLDKYPRDLL